MLASHLARALLFVGILLLSQAVYSSTDSYYFTGTVVDRDSGAPLEGIAVSLESKHGWTQSVMTDGMGRYFFSLDGTNASGGEVRLTLNGINQPAANGHRYLAAKDWDVPNILPFQNDTLTTDFAMQCADCGKISLPRILFNLGKRDLFVSDKVNSQDSLRVLYDILQDNPSIVIELECHTDARGSDRPNAILSQKRAETCANYLIEWGIDPVRVIPVGYGEQRPLVPDDQISKASTQEEREVYYQKNRRTVFQVLAFDYVPLAETSLVFKLEGTITDMDTKEPLGNVLIKLLGTDGSVQQQFTDPTGFYQFEVDSNGNRCIQPATGYTMEVSAIELPAANGHRYMSMKGQESTMWMDESTAFVYDFALNCLDCTGCGNCLPQILFPEGGAELDNRFGDMRDSLKFMVDILNENPTVVLELGGHTDSRASKRHAKKLSMLRAEACKEYLIELGIAEARLVANPYGATRPRIEPEQIEALPTEEERARAHGMNNRVVFSVLSFDYPEP